MPKRSSLPLLALAVFVPAMLVCCTTAAVPERPSIILFVLDTLRVDAVSSYGRLAGTTPILDQLAATGLRFTNAYSQAPWTLPSHATLFTGLLPSQHGMSWRRIRAPDAWVTLPELLRDAGYETVGVSENGMLSETFNMTQGFERFTNVRDGGPDVGAIVEQWWRERDAARPFFLFVNLFDAHGPFEIREQNPFLPADVTAEAARSLSQKPEDYFCATSRDDRTMAILWGLYLGDVQEGDRKLGDLLRIFREPPATRPLVTVVTSDHGEHFGEHRLFQHHFSVREPLLHVPLVIHGLPGVAPAVIDTPVALADLMPTLLEWARVAPPQGLVGRPLPTHGGAAGAPRALVAEHDDYAGELLPGAGKLPSLMKKQGDSMRRACGPNDRVFGGMRAIVRHPSKLIWYESYPPQLYDLLADPEEQKNLAASHPELVAALSAELHRETATPPGERTAGGDDATLDQDQVERLRALGYITVDEPAGGGPDAP